MQSPFHPPSGSQEYVGDSFGDHIYIDVNEPRTCPVHCGCWSNAHALVFTAIKTPNSFDIQFHSLELYQQVLRVVWALQKPMKNRGGQRVCGFTLLKYHDSLQKHLQTIRAVDQYERRNRNLVSELTLLVNGLLDDPDVFRSYGYENLAKKGYLSPRAEKRFQNAKAHRDLDALENAFYTAEELPVSQSQQAPKPAKLVPQTNESLSFDEIYDISFPRWQTTQRSYTNEQVRETSTPSGSVLDDVYCRDLSLAAYMGKLEWVKSYLDRGMSPNSTRTPFFLGQPLVEAIKGDHPQVVDLLLDQGADVNGTIVKRICCATQDQRSNGLLQRH